MRVVKGQEVSGTRRASAFSTNHAPQSYNKEEHHKTAQLSLLKEKGEKKSCSLSPPPTPPTLVDCSSDGDGGA